METGFETVNSIPLILSIQSISCSSAFQAADVHLKKSLITAITAAPPDLTLLKVVSAALTNFADSKNEESISEFPGHCTNRPNNNAQQIATL